MQERGRKLLGPCLTSSNSAGALLLPQVLPELTFYPFPGAPSPSCLPVPLGTPRPSEHSGSSPSVPPLLTIFLTGAALPLLLHQLGPPGPAQSPLLRPPAPSEHLLRECQEARLSLPFLCTTARFKPNFEPSLGLHPL